MMDAKKEFEAFENAMIEALRAGVVEIDSIFIHDNGREDLRIITNKPCTRLIDEMYAMRKRIR